MSQNDDYERHQVIDDKVSLVYQTLNTVLSLPNGYLTIVVCMQQIIYSLF
jgi:hypothetical protein